MNSINFHHPQLGWVDFSKSEYAQDGLETHVKRLFSLGFDLIDFGNEESDVKIIDFLSEFPFIDYDFTIFIKLLADGWERMAPREFEESSDFKAFLNIGSKSVLPIYKKFGSDTKCVFDANGFCWVLGRKKVFFATPLPF